MKDQFDIWRFDFPGKGEHSVILISHPDVCARAWFVNVLYCTSQRQSRPPKPYEVMLKFFNCAAMDAGHIPNANCAGHELL